MTTLAILAALFAANIAHAAATTSKLSWQYRWQVWLPDNWQRLGACETGYGKRPGNWNHHNSLYVSAFGSHNLKISRYIPSGMCFALDMSTWDVAYLRPFQTVEVAKVGDADRRTILAEWTLVARTPTANTKAVGIS